jgi:hypothetical protein
MASAGESGGPGGFDCLRGMNSWAKVKPVDGRASIPQTNKQRIGLTKHMNLPPIEGNMVIG